MAVLETIAAANAAYSVIKKCLENGREVSGIVSHVGKFLSAEDDLKDAVKRKKNNPITAITGRLYGPPGTWDKWQLYQAEARKARRAAQKQKEKEREELVETLMICLGCLFAISGMVALIYAVGRYMEKW